MYLEKVILSKNQAQTIMKNYLEKIIDFVDGEIQRNESGAYIIDTLSYHDEELKRMKAISTKSYFDILRLALLDSGYSVRYIKEFSRGNEVKYECIYELVSKKGR